MASSDVAAKQYAAMVATVLLDLLRTVSGALFLLPEVRLLQQTKR